MTDENKQEQEETNKKDVELELAIAELSKVVEARGLVHMTLLADDNGARLVSHFPRWFAVQASNQGFAAIPRNFKEGLDPVRTVNIGLRFVQIMGQIATQVQACLKAVVTMHKVVITNTVSPEDKIILPAGVQRTPKKRNH